ncbi:unnamed protein product [Musa acuminata subsp. malaccensis]|uniref:non-specific serine/threonine protein kinase n=1 Tax=Musa acuminata subsp. malaccensis TaxID=214687 RepID=A0A804INQ4_MUSAM|nr:PREDICTED: probable serine/threonine-protein kinase Cx32, chloroplastic [Musa acuminata subsp. malaccensis]CAG1841910.1 unnamed protein product [Musa acuminata subsp. malaccensis]
MGNCCTFCANYRQPSNTGHQSTFKASSSDATTEKLSTHSCSFGRSTVSGASGDEEFPEGRILEVPNLRTFTFAEMKIATRNFRPDTILGEGGFGRVYKGWVEEKTLNPAKTGLGMIVAVKKLSPDSMQGLEQWQSEVKFLGRLSHPNLVKLLGYCLEDNELLLVYEYMARGSLESHLFRKGESYEPLSWSLRLKIAIGAARGLAFLHTSEKEVIYRDFKAANILLDSNYNAKLSDFGLAKNGPTDGDTHVTTRIMGTMGYAAPEYMATGHLYVKSDVYGFGVVVLEMLTGMRAVDTNRPVTLRNLVTYARPSLSDRRKLARLMDRRLEGQYPPKGALQVAQLTLECLASDPKKRPNMKEVVQRLEQIEDLKGRPREEAVAGSRGPSSSHNHSPRIA